MVETTYAAMTTRAAAVEAPITTRMLAAARAVVRAPREEVVLGMVYLTKVRKMRLGKLRVHLKEWGIDTRRVSNLSFIGGNILEAAVTTAYKREFLETVTRMGWQHVPDFDPLSERTLRRSTTQTMSTERRKELATRLYVQRIARSVRTTRPGPLRRFLEEMMRRAPNYADHLADGAGAPAPANQEDPPPERGATPTPTPAPTPTMTAELAAAEGAATEAANEEEEATSPP
jgi:hypothetical protein